MRRQAAEARERISPGMLSFLVESRRVDNRRMREELGVEPRYAGLDAGIAQMAELRRALAAFKCLPHLSTLEADGP
mgnify:CR=1 FL=1